MVAQTFTCNLCEALCGLTVTMEGGRAESVRGNPDDVLSRGHVCPKAHALVELDRDADRLRTPVRRTAAGWEPISWDDALAEAAARLGEVRRRHGKDAVGLYVGNPTVHSHRAALGSQLLTMALGTKNRFDPNSQDSNPRLYACMQVYGDALSIPVPDIERTEHLLILGANPAVSNGSQMVLGDVRTRMRAIKSRGGRVVLVDPRRNESAGWATSHHFIRPGGDAALLLAILHVLFATGRVDRPRIERSASGVDELAALAARFAPERVAPAIGITAPTIRDIAAAFGDARSACAYGRVGVCQNEFGPVACWLIEALNVVTGNFDREGGAMFPAPAADIAPLGRMLIGNAHGRWRSRVRGLPEFLGALPSAVMAEEMETPGAGQIRAFVCFAGNPVLTTPNGERLARALPGLGFMLAVDFYLNETTRHAHIVLPAQHVFETGNFDILLSRFTVRNTAKYSPPICAPRGDERGDWEILSELALRIAAPDSPLLRRVWRRISPTLPESIVDLLLRTGPYRLRLAELRAAPNGLDLGPLRPAGGKAVRTPDGRVRLAPPALLADIPRLERWLDERRDKLVLIGRRDLRSNNSWLHNLPSMAKGPDRARLLMHPDDAALRVLRDGQRVRIKSRTGEASATLGVSDSVMPGVVSLPHGFGHQVASDTMRTAGALAGPNANAVTDELFVEPLLGTSILSGVPVEVESP